MESFSIAGGMLEGKKRENEWEIYIKMCFAFFALLSFFFLLDCSESEVILFCCGNKASPVLFCKFIDFYHKHLQQALELCKFKELLTDF